jgi:hypothetical protein
MKFPRPLNIRKKYPGGIIQVFVHPRKPETTDPPFFLSKPHQCRAPPETEVETGSETPCEQGLEAAKGEGEFENG